MTEFNNIKLPLFGNKPQQTESLNSGSLEPELQAPIFGGFTKIGNTPSPDALAGFSSLNGFSGFTNAANAPVDLNAPLFSGFAGFGTTTTEGNYPASYSHSPNVKLDKNFLNRVKEIANNLNCNYEDLLAIMNSESGLNSKAVNPKGGATGLIQFMPETARSLGTTTEALRNMSPIEQLGYVEKYLQKVKASAGFGQQKLSAGDLYALVFMPANAKKNTLATAGTKAYAYNKGVDRDNNGQITKDDLARHLATKRVDINKVFG